MKIRPTLALLLGGLAALALALFTAGPVARGQEALADPTPIPPNYLDVKKTAAQPFSWPGETIDYTVVVTLGMPRSGVTVEDLFLSGVDLVPGSAQRDGLAIPDPVLIVRQPGRIVYEFRLGDQPAGTITLTYRGRVDPNKPCLGQKVRNDVHLHFNGAWGDQSWVETPLRCGPPPVTTPTDTPTATPTPSGPPEPPTFTPTPTSTSTPTVTPTATPTPTPGALPPRFVDIKKTAVQDYSWPGGLIDYTVAVSLGSSKNNVTVEDLFLYGVDLVPGSARLNGSSISDPAQTTRQPQRVGYEFQLGSLPAGITTLTFQGKVDPGKPCRGQKVRNDARLRFGGLWADQSALDTPLQCSPPVQFGVVAVGSGTDDPAFLSAALAELGAGSWYSYAGSNAPAIGGKVEMVRPGADLTALTTRARAKPGTAWIIGNEPNVPGQDNQSPEDYADFLRQVSSAIKGADGTAVLVGPNVLNWEEACPNCNGGYTKGREWSEAFLTTYQSRYGALPFNAWGMHAYTLDWSQLPMLDAPTDQAQLSGARSWIDGRGLNLPLWLTEFGVIWGYDGMGCVEYQGSNCTRFSPVGEFQSDEIQGYMDSMLGWLTGPSGRAARVQRWFLYATAPPPEPYATEVAGISLLEEGGLSLTRFGERFRLWASGALP